MSFDTTLVQLEEQKAALLRGLEAWSPESLTKRPAAGEWSAVEVVDHLVRTESEITRYAQAGLSAPRDTGIRDRLGFLMVERVFLSQRKVKVPAGAPVHPGEALAVDEVVLRWDRTRQDVACLVKACGQGYDPKQAIFQHPVSGWMTLGQVLRFFSVHIVHHEFQMERIRARLEGSRS